VLERQGVDRFADVAYDTVAAILNDLCCVGALPLVVNAYFATGASDWYQDAGRAAALLEGCVVEDGALVGMGAIMLQRSRLGRAAILGAGSVLREGAEIPAGMLAAGTPAQVKKPVAPDGHWGGDRPVRVYRELADAHATSAVEIER